MATNVLWQRTQLDYGSSRFDTFQRQPPHFNTQLQFNLGVPSSPDSLATKFRKPHPIIIEKLGSNAETEQQLSCVRKPPVTFDTFPQTLPLSVDSSISSERLATAIRLAKRDVKKAKESVNVDLSAPEPATDGEQKATKKVKSKSYKTTSGKERDELTLRNRVQSAVRRQAAFGPLAPAPRGIAQEKQPQYYFYPASGGDFEYEGSDGEKKQANEIRKLRKELHQYVKQLEALRHEGPTILRNKDKRIKRKRGNDFKLSDDEADQRQVARAEEQAARSARMLYVLQRQVKELEDEINRKGRHIKHTKKSQTLSRLAAAHRGAVRALQSFISHAPLQPKISHGLPPMYQELSLLIRQLSLLSAQLQIGGENSLPDDLLGVRPGKSSTAVHHSEGDRLLSNMSPSKDEPERDLPTRRGNLKPPAAELGSPDPTPERDAILKAGLAALMRARQTPTHLSAVNLKERAQTHGQQRLPQQPPKRSVLLPSRLQVKRQKAQAALQIIKAVNMNAAHFAQDTVSSKLKKAPPVSPPRAPLAMESLATPPRTPVGNHPAHVRPASPGEMRYPPHRSPRRNLEQQMKSPRRLRPLEKELMEREIARQHWLDRETERRLRELDELCDAAHHRRREARRDIDMPQRLVSEAERAIRAKLKPLLDQAEAIVDENIRRETQHQQSLRQRLTGVVSDAAMSQADLLADMILDDILVDTVDEMQRLESDDETEEMAENLQNRSTLENLFQRLQSFERTEDSIRRHYVQVNYADTGRTQATSEDGETGERGYSKPHEVAKEPRPIVFTSSQPVCSRDFVSERIEQLREKQRARHSRDSRARASRMASKTHENYGDASNLSSPEDSLTKTDTSPNLDQDEGRLGPRPHVYALEKPTISLCVPSEMRASIAANRSRYERYLRQTATHVQGTFDPWKLVEEVSEDLLDDVLADVATEFQSVCDDFAEGVYLEEFAVVRESRLSSQSQ